MATVVPSEGSPRRVPVNPISGQVGVQGGAGVVTALTQRVTLASDVALPAGTNVIGHVIVDSGSVGVTNAGTFVVQENGAALTSLQLIDDVVHAAGATLSKVAAIGAQFDDSSPGTVTEDKISPVRMSTRRELYVQLRDAAGNERGLNIDASGQTSITDITNSVTPGTGSTNLGKAEGATRSSVGVYILAVNNRNNASFSTTQNRYAPIAVADAGGIALAAALDGSPFGLGQLTQNATNGGLNINAKGGTIDAVTAITNPVTVVNAGTFAVQDAAAEASLSVIDDWDESDRAKVNPIVGQAGVQGNTGVVTALTQRVTLATDVSIPPEAKSKAYSSASGFIAIDSGGATDFFTIYGSNTKTIKITKLRVQLTEDLVPGVDIGGVFTVSAYAVEIYKRSAADSGGTPVTCATIAHDSNNAVATATVKAYTARPTAGAGTLLDSMVITTSPNDLTTGNIPGGGSPDPYWNQWSDLLAQPVTLRGTSEGLVAHLPQFMGSNGGAYCYVEWVEE